MPRLASDHFEQLRILFALLAHCTGFEESYCVAVTHYTRSPMNPVEVIEIYILLNELVGEWVDIPTEAKALSSIEIKTWPTLPLRLFVRIDASLNLKI